MVRSMLKAKHLPHEYWEEAVTCAVYILNRCPTKAIMNKIPKEAWSGQKQTVTRMRVFGYVAYAHVPDQLRKKLDSKGEKCVFIGYSDESKAYKLYNPSTKKLIISRDVRFIEDEACDGSLEKAVNVKTIVSHEKEEEGTTTNNPSLVAPPPPQQVDATLYRQLVGSLIYLTTTRPDLAYSVSVLSQFMSRPLDSHWNAANCVLMYLSGTCNYGLLYTDISDVTLAGYSDSDWVGNLDDRRSITGYAFSIGSGVISWSSKKQSTVALSSCEAEYQALSAATCEAIWLRRLLSDADESQKEATSIKTDNQSTIKLAYNPIFHKNTKHIDTQFHFVRESYNLRKFVWIIVILVII
eukprot:PITA_05509